MFKIIYLLIVFIMIFYLRYLKAHLEYDLSFEEFIRDDIPEIKISDIIITIIQGVLFAVLIASIMMYIDPLHSMS